MRRIVVKLGSSVVADDDGELRTDVLAARSATQLAAVHAAGGRGGDRHERRDRARACGCMGLAARPTRDRGAAGRERRRAGQALPRLRRAAARARRHERAGAADVLRHERPHALPERAPDAAARCSSGASCRSSTRTTRPRPTRSPSATTTSSPRRSRSSSAPTRLVLLTDIDGLYTADPRADPDARSSARSSDFADAGRPRDRRSDLAARLGRDALEGRRRRDGDRRRASPTVICNGLRAGALARCSRASRERARASRPREARYRSFKLWLKYAKPVARARSSSTTAPRARCARGAPACCRSASSRCAGDFDAGDAVEIAELDGEAAPG